MKIELKPIGYIKNNRKEISDDFWGNVISELELTSDFSEQAMKGLNEFSHAEIIFYFNKAEKDKAYRSTRHPRGNTDWPEVGVFAQRVKDRPNHLGHTIAEVISVDGRILKLKGLDAVDGSPVLDIKPVLKEFLPKTAVRQPEWSKQLMKDYWK